MKSKSKSSKKTTRVIVDDEEEDQAIVIDPNALSIGCKVMVEKSGEGLRKAEILSVRNSNETDQVYYYVHYLDFNKRLDEWIPSSVLNMSHVEFPLKQSKLSSSSSTPQPVPLVPSNPLTIADDLEEEQTQTATFSKQDEREKLRTSGSMTQCVNEISRVKNLNRIVMGLHIVDTWYFSPYPHQLAHLDTLYICEFCLMYFKSQVQLARHRQKCTLLHPPGNEIYRKDAVSFFEIDGKRQKQYCRNLCLLSKCFLDHKTLYYDVDPFLFYLMTVTDQFGSHLVGYFSKEKDSAEGYNLACILTLPQYQRQGYGRVLIQFSYELSKVEHKPGSPEKPLSDLGLLSYRAYWTEIILDCINTTPEISIEELARHTCITTKDIIDTLVTLNALRLHKGTYVIVLSEQVLNAYAKTKQKKKRTDIDPTCLEWKGPPTSTTLAREKYIN